ncbi:hypothetical protein PHSY_005359 [Pseudozyma hubeiensis SY62]|uniref:PSP proline-rich domain-containing protein n=1 Tax=Pseudozyma hubeiensis (strain SY62) TaxID=1305764 RepID=R9P939_PSEHS|nr:hypothetical protein PHSY_005359 [Pseudozyma hubeiensis SY62]GAC97772.1 hypothetical protein PHSY_005359 [Pseudozyma hubeiensis SY62]
MAANAVAGPSKVNGNGSAAAPAPLTKNAKRRLKKKQQQQQPQPQTSIAATPSVKQEPDANYDDDVEASTSIIHQAADFRIDPDSEVYKAFSSVLSRYQPETLSQQQQPSKGEIIYSDDEVESAHSSSDAEGDGGATSHSLSKRKQKKLARLTVAELKQLVPKPEVVEWTDVTSSDPRLLVHLKSTRNTVPIPPHWSHKRDYLQHKRGIEKPPYTLPPYISDTGIATMKDALKEKEGDYSLKQKTRERVQPKMGKMEIDYQKLWDAFFKFQTKPELSSYGDTYYEGKEYENKYKEKRPGMLSAELIEALSIPPDAPPPWLIAMQRFGPPPSYPHLQIPGLNAPIPQGASWGFHPGGWGRPPVDEYGNPLYANVLANLDGAVDDELVDKVEKEHWGLLEVEESDPEEEEEEEEPEEETQQPVDLSGVQSVTSTSAGLETPSFTQLRKDERIDSHPRSLYQVLPERTPASSGGQNQFLASERIYDLSSASSAVAGPALGAEDSRANKRAAPDQVQLSMDPDNLDQEQQLAERYDAERKAQGSARFGGYAEQDREGVSEMRQQLQDERRREDERRVKQRRG